MWGYQGDVYLVGWTNVGKSSLFNILVDSDYSKVCSLCLQILKFSSKTKFELIVSYQVQASSLVQRATTCVWPGTTLKFLILRPSGKHHNCCLETIFIIGV